MTSRRQNTAPGAGWTDRAKQRAAIEEKRKNIAAAIAHRSKPDSASQSDTAPRTVRDFRNSLEALARLNFYNVGSDQPQNVSPLSQALLKAAIEALNAGGSLVLLSWPPHRLCIPAIIDFLALADVAAAPQHRFTPGPGRIDTVADAPLGLRALLFPASRRSHTAAREVQVDRQQLATLQKAHVLRGVYGSDDDALKDYHTVLGRVGAMTGRGRDGRAYAEYEHPVLDELVPFGSAQDGTPDRGALLSRTKSRTDLAKFTGRSGLADQPGDARFYLFEASSERLLHELRELRHPLDLVILDLTNSGQARLAGNWLTAARKAADAIRAAFPATAILAITDDPWSYDAARFDVLGTRPANAPRKPRPVPARTIYSLSGELLENSAAPTPFVGCLRIVADGFTGELATTIGKVRTVAAKLQDRGNPIAAEAARRIIAKLRRAVCLPGSLADLSAFLERETLDAIAAENMSAYRIAPDLAVLDDPRQGATQVGSDELAAARAEVSRLIAASEAATPMSSLLDQTMGPVLRSSSRSIIVFRTEMVADFARDRLCATFERLEPKLESDVIRLTTRQGLADLAAFTPPFRNQFKRAIVVAPARQTILETLSQPWLPDEVAFLADSDTLRFAARDAARLAMQIENYDLKRRLEGFSRAAATRVEQLGVHAVELDANVPPSDDIDFPDGSIIDLAGPQRGDQPLIELQMRSGPKIIARPRTGLVRRDESRSVRRFIEISASDVSIGDEICAIGPRFIERARALLNITAAAAEEIRDYHDLVRRRFNDLDGENRAAKLRTLCGLMGEPRVLAGTASYWIDLENEAEKPLHEVIAHAPRDREQFNRFTRALGISTQLAARFWAWAVIAQRSSRVRAGAAFHDAYKGILTDEHAALAANTGRAAEIRSLRAAADEYVSQVVGIKKLGGA